MMKLLFNGNLIDEPIPLSVHDRAFQYGDGFFETMLWTGGELPLLENHLRRVFSAAANYHFDLPESDFRFLHDNIDTLIQLNEIDADRVKVKLAVWRRVSPAGGYRTTERHVNWSVTVFPLERPMLHSGIRLGFCESVRIPVYPWSGAKSMNAQPYVMASFECAERQLDDLILQNQSGQVAECIESNLFWRENNTWFTPSLESACVSGIMRAQVIDFLNAGGEEVKEVLCSPEEIAPTEAFTCNALHFASVAEWGGKSLTENTERLESWIQAIKNPVS